MDERDVLLQAIVEEARDLRRDLREGRTGSGGLLATTREVRAMVGRMTATCDRLDAKLDVIDEHRRNL